MNSLKIIRCVNYEYLTLGQVENKMKAPNSIAFYVAESENP